jgi:hypothetical protein
MPYFHRNPGDFQRARQRDLVKNYFTTNQPHVRLIRIDHTLFKHKGGNSPVNRITKYISDAINSTDKIFANREIYTWIDDKPDIKYIEKYII